MSTSTHKFEIRGGDRKASVNLKEVWEYRDLILLFVKRDFNSFYKQTILGPIWFFVQPLLSSFIYAIVMSGALGADTGESPVIMFYLSGITLFTYFRDVFNKTANTFIANSHIYGKVYFPRIVLPLSYMLSSLLRLALMFVALFGFGIYFWFTGNLEMNTTLFLLPVYIIILGLLGLGGGLLMSVLISKYRDFKHVLEFSTQILMWASFVVLSLRAYIPEEHTWKVMLNPLVSIIEGFRHGLIGEGVFDTTMILYSAGISIVILFISLFFFGRAEKNFIDTV